MIGFAFLVHKDIPSVIQLFESLYRPQHFYVFHVDWRQSSERESLKHKIEERFPMSDNIVILPTERSFVTSWGSFGLVRALLEAYEELCRMGTWDFAINLSGSDLPLRSVEDLSLALGTFINHVDTIHYFSGHLNHFLPILATP